MTQQDSGGGREWRPYEIATPIARDAAGAMPPPLGAGASPYAAPRAAVGGYVAAATAKGFVLASLGKRLAAALIDIAMWALPMLLIASKAYHAYTLRAQGLPVGSGLGTGFMVAGFLWLGLAAWNIAWLAIHAQTPGKRFVGIRVVRSDGSPASFWRLLLLRGALMNGLGNGAARIVPAAGTIIWLVDVLFIFGKNRQTLHDMLADTIVVDA